MTITKPITKPITDVADAEMSEELAAQRRDAKEEAREERWFLLRRRGDRSVWRTAEELGWGPRDADRAERHLRSASGSGMPDDAYDINEGAGTGAYTLPARDGGHPLVCSDHCHLGRVKLTVMRGAQVAELVYRGTVRPTASAEMIHRGYGHHYGVAADA